MSLVPFTFKNVKLKVVTINGKPWARTKEVCRALKYDAKTSKTANIIRAHCSWENYAQNYQMTSVHAACSMYTCELAKGFSKIRYLHQ